MSLTVKQIEAAISQLNVLRDEQELVEQGISRIEVKLYMAGVVLFHAPTGTSWSYKKKVAQPA